MDHLSVYSSQLIGREKGSKQVRPMHVLLSKGCAHNAMKYRLDSESVLRSPSAVFAWSHTSWPRGVGPCMHAAVSPSPDAQSLSFSQLVRWPSLPG